MSAGLRLEVPEGLPYTEHTRELDHPVSAVYRAHTDADLFARWIGPRGLTTRVETLDVRPGGSFRFVQSRPGEDGEYAFRGVVHTARENDLILQTFEYEGYPDVVTLESLRFTGLPDRRCRVTGRSVYPDLAARERYLIDGMATGIEEGYERLDELLTGERTA